MVAPVVGAGVKGNQGGGSGPIVIPFTVTTSGNAVLVATTHIDPSSFVAAGVSGIPGSSFSKLKEGIPVSETGFENYKGSPSLWLATNVAAGNYTLNVEFSGATDLYGSAVVQEISPVSLDTTNTMNNGTSNLPETGSVNVPADSLTISLVAYSPNPGSGSIGFNAPPSGWVRQGVENNNASFTGLVCDSYVSSTSATISESFPSSDGGSSEWSVITVTFTSAAAATSRRPLVVVDGALRELQDGDLTGLANHASYASLSSDDHPQYHNDVRGDLRYSQLNHTQQASTLEQSGAFGRQVARWDGSVWTPSFQDSTGQATNAYMDSDSTTTGNTLKKLGKFGIGIEPNSVHQIDCVINLKHATSNSITLYLFTPEGARNMVEIVVSISPTIPATLTKIRKIFPNGADVLNSSWVVGTTNSAVDTKYSCRISGIIRNGPNAGDCQVYYTMNQTGATTILSTSYFSLWKLN